MYYVLCFDRNFPDAATIVDRPEVPGFPQLTFNRGIRLSENIPRFDLVMDDTNQGILTDYLWTMYDTTFSARFRKALDEAGVDNVDYYPIRIVNQVTGEVRDDYYQANIVGNIACMNRGESEIVSSPNLARIIRSIPRLAIDESKIHGELFFRLAELQDIILAHERVKTQVEAAKLTGVVFVPANGYSWP